MNIFMLYTVLCRITGSRETMVFHIFKYKICKTGLPWAGIFVVLSCCAMDFIEQVFLERGY